MVQREALSLLALLNTARAGPVTINRLVTFARACGRSLSELIDTPRKELAALLPAGAGRYAAVLQSCGAAQRATAQRQLDAATKASATVVTILQENYPRAMRRCLEEQSPPVLFLKGNARLLHGPAVAIVGARKAAAGGIALAKACAEAFAAHGITVVSGGANGVDIAAHLSALENNGNTIIVLPMGILKYRLPPKVAQALSSGRVCIISEFVPDADWLTYAAVTRNATIAALARMVCVVEPRKVGGSIRTALLSLRHGKPVFCYPDPKQTSVRIWMRNAGIRELTDGSGQVDVFSLFEAWPGQPREDKQLGLV